MDPLNFIGRAPSQVDDFLRECVYPILEQNKSLINIEVDINV